jgi:hypothetical protein
VLGNGVLKAAIIAISVSPRPRTRHSYPIKPLHNKPAEMTSMQFAQTLPRPPLS